VGDDGRVGQRGGKGNGRVGGKLGHLEVRSHDCQCLDNSGIDIPFGNRSGSGGSTGVDENIKCGLGESSNLGESGSSSQSLDTIDETTEVSSGDSGVSDQLDQITNNDTSHSLGVGRSLLESSAEKGDKDGEGGCVDLGDESGGGEDLDGVGDSAGRGHGGNKDRNVLDDIGVGEDTAKGSSSLVGGSRYLDYQR
jgi:hypothetical protein